MKLRKFSFGLIGLLVVVFILMLFLTSCNKTIFDTSYKFDYAYVKLGDQTIAEGKVQSWDDWEDSDMVQVKINGVVYYTHGSNVVLIDN